MLTDVLDIWTDRFIVVQIFNNYHIQYLPAVIVADPECIPCELPVFEEGVLIACNHAQGDIISSFIGGTGLNVCDNGFHKDTRGECKPVYKFSSFLKPVDVEPMKTKKKKQRNLRKYLQSIGAF